MPTGEGPEGQIVIADKNGATGGYGEGGANSSQLDAADSRAFVSASKFILL